ncbi:MAG: hypothetical protein JNL54_11200 [Kineosporiaceae bacterium]|nr:hypothetical protein [Kineosporiaceae bacterium]
MEAVTTLRTLARQVLGAFLIVTGTGHLSFARTEFQAQVPSWIPVDADRVVVVSGVAELVLGLALLAAPQRWRGRVGWVVAAFLVAIFPGNLAQWAEGRDAFGLDSDAARAVRLVFQPVLVAWALWSTGAWREWRRTAQSGSTGRPRRADS